MGKLNYDDENLCFLDEFNVGIKVDASLTKQFDLKINLEIGHYYLIQLQMLRKYYSLKKLQLACNHRLGNKL